MIIYALIDPRTDEIRYIGKTVRSAHRRLRRHLADSYMSSNTHKDRWLRVLKALGLDPLIKVIQRCGSADELAVAECQQIAAHRRAGVRLTNLTDGGDGTVGWHHTEESRAKLSAALKGKPKSETHRLNAARAQLGRKASEETRSKLSAERRMRGWYPPPRYGLANNKTKLTDDQRVQIYKLRGKYSQRELARRFGVSHVAIGKIQRSDMCEREFPR